MAKKQKNNQKQRGENKTENEKDIKKLSDISQLPEELEPVLQDLPEPKRSEIIKAIIGISIKRSSLFSGPIPPPEILKGYNEIIRDGAERIFEMAEKQSNHRITLEAEVIKEELRQSSRGQIFGFILGFVGLGLATALAILGHEAIAGIFGTTTLIGLVTVFVIGKKSQGKNQ